MAFSFDEIVDAFLKRQFVCHRIEQFERKCEVIVGASENDPQTIIDKEFGKLLKIYKLRKALTAKARCVRIRSAPNMQLVSYLSPGDKFVRLAVLPTVLCFGAGARHGVIKMPSICIRIVKFALKDGG